MFFGITTIWSWEAIVRFVDIGGIVDHHCLHFHHIICTSFNYKSTLLVSPPLLQCNCSGLSWGGQLSSISLSASEIWPDKRGCPLIRQLLSKITPLVRPLPPKITPLVRPLPSKITPLARPLPPKATHLVKPDFKCSEILKHY